MPASLLRVIACFAGCCIVAGCATVPPPVVAYRQPVPPRGLVLVLDGAGGDPDALQAIARAVDESGTPLVVRAFDWTHQRGLGLADMTDVAHAQAQGRRLAAEIASYRANYPRLSIYLLAYSAGAHVTLEAGKWLAPDSVERMVLLAPAVAADYDVRPALRASRQGIDAFTSERDRWILGGDARGGDGGRQEWGAARRPRRFRHAGRRRC